MIYAWSALGRRRTDRHLDHRARDLGALRPSQPSGDPGLLGARTESVGAGLRRDAEDRRVVLPVRLAVRRLGLPVAARGIQELDPDLAERGADLLRIDPSGCEPVAETAVLDLECQRAIDRRLLRPDDRRAARGRTQHERAEDERN